MNPKTKQDLMSAIVAYDKRMTSGELRRKNVPNVYRFGHLCRALSNIEEMVDRGVELRASILRATTDRLCDRLLKAAGLPLMTLEEARR